MGCRIEGTQQQEPQQSRVVRALSSTGCDKPEASRSQDWGPCEDPAAGQDPKKQECQAGNRGAHSGVGCAPLTVQLSGGQGASLGMGLSM